MSNLPNTNLLDERRQRQKKMTQCAQNPLLVAWIHGEMSTLGYKNNLLPFMCQRHFCSQETDCIWRKTHNHTNWAPFKFMTTNFTWAPMLPGNPTLCSMSLLTPLDENHRPLSSDLIGGLFLFLWENMPSGEACISMHDFYPSACFHTCISALPPVASNWPCSHTRPTPASEIKNIIPGAPRCLCGWASAFSPGRDPRVPGSSPTSGSPQGACFSLCLWIIK